ncbi:HIT family protein [Patescibacteria group bacterium]|nr:HIT family protein [Patescibacteria group bacterium]
MSTNCIFCKINKGEIPAYTLYKDELVRVFLDAFPEVEGHLLIIPKEHCENIFDASEEVLVRINLVAKKMALILKDKLGATGINVINNSGADAQQEVPHLHYHIIPRFKNDALNLKFNGAKKEERGIVVEETFKKLK